MCKFFQHIFVVAALVCAATATAATTGLDLPVREVDGAKYYIYQTYRGDNLADISRQLGISREEIIACNPWAADGLKSGQLLMFPVEKYSHIHPNGKITGTHVVVRGESLFGIAHRYGLNPDDLITANPDARHGIKAGDVLTIPLIGDAEAPSATAAAPAEEEAPASIPELPERDLSLRDPSPEVVIVDKFTDNDDDDDVEIADEVIDDDDDIPEEMARTDRAIAVLLPFMLGSAEPTRQAELLTDFYKGMLMGVNDMISLRSEPVEVRVFDTYAPEGVSDSLHLAALLANPRVNRAAIIVPPDNDASLRMIADMALSQGNTVFNVLNVRDTTYLTNPAVIQANIPHQQMYRKAVDYLLGSMQGYTPVVLSNKGGQSDKAAFIEYLRGRYADEGLEVVDVVFDGSPHNGDFDVLQSGKAYVIIPSSGTAAEFNKVSHILRNLQNTRGDRSLTRIFGYPDWMAFRGDARHMLHVLDAEIFSRFYYPTAEGNDEFADDFRRWYGQAMLPTVPSQAALGYDTGAFLLRTLRDSDATVDPDLLTPYRGRQSSFDIAPLEEGGRYVNRALYLIRFSDDNTELSRVI